MRTMSDVMCTYNQAKSFNLQNTKETTGQLEMVEENSWETGNKWRNGWINTSPFFDSHSASVSGVQLVNPVKDGGGS